MLIGSQKIETAVHADFSHTNLCNTNCGQTTQNSLKCNIFLTCPTSYLKHIYNADGECHSAVDTRSIELYVRKYARELNSQKVHGIEIDNLGTLISVQMEDSKNLLRKFSSIDPRRLRHTGQKKQGRDTEYGHLFGANRWRGYPGKIA